MNLKQQKILWGSLIGLLVIILGWSLYIIYGNLGGFDEVKVYRLEPAQRTVVGKYYKTRYSDKALKEQFERCQTLIESNHVKGDLVVFSYQNPDLAANEVEQFIGIMLKEDIAEIPVDFDMKEFNSGDRYAVFLSMHPLVRMPEKQYRKLLRETASGDGGNLQEFFVEIYFPDNSMTVEVWVQ
ncbi:hypothetical protein [Marinoscillum sp. MHG1-6]|uniref:hypothetical protein n=1 Tax=Marinoscillum sp. MHG1-6 TaxID=2959627 RepID=UPI0021583DC9|nr:hypothetical protein [Marinoscillum sp. MHG1-6]